jgi:hypothetical protein
MANPRANWPHGDFRRYLAPYGCRCDACRAANTAKQREARANRRAALISGSAPALIHGLGSTYREWGCRCDRCTEATRRGTRWAAQKGCRGVENWLYG